MTTRLVVTGTPDLNPDCTTPDTGPPAGESEGQPYWVWDGFTLYYLPNGGAHKWCLEGDGSGNWYKTGDISPVGDYPPGVGTTGTVTIAELPPAGGCGPPRALFDW